MKVVSCALNKLQSDSTKLSNAVEIWMDLKESPELLPYRGVIKKRMDEAVTPFHLLANMLDPQFFGARLSSKQESEAEDFLKSRNDEWLPILMSLKIKDEMFPENMFEKNVIEKLPGAKWYMLLKKKNAKTNRIPDEFLDFVINLLVCPASTASLERIFSTYGLIWTDLRNRLGPEKAEKLVKVNRFLNDKDKAKV